VYRWEFTYAYSHSVVIIFLFAFCRITGEYKIHWLILKSAKRKSFSDVAMCALADVSKTTPKLFNTAL
jgi:drug/metabolite transporter superfamily protein YnfA